MYIGSFMRAWISILSFWLVTLSFNASALDYYVVIDEPINVRSGPGTQFPMQAQVHKNEQVLLIKKEGDWANIFFIHPDGRKLEGWLHGKFIQPLEQKLQENSVLKTEVLGAHLACQPNAENNGVGSCLLDIDLTVNGPTTIEAAEVHCESEVLISFNSGENNPIQESGRIRTPLKNGVGAARMQIVIFPVTTGVVERINVVDYRCLAKQA